MKKLVLVWAASCLSLVGWSASSLEVGDPLNDGGFFIEPSVTYERSDARINWPVVRDSSGSLDGFGVGLRLGGHVADIFFLGGDVRYNFADFKQSVTNGSTRAQSWNFAPVFGVQTPFYGVRAWASYVLGATVDPEATNGFDVKFKDGQGFRLGLGLRYMMIGVNLEYQSINYENLELQSAANLPVGLTAGGADMLNNSWIVSVSMPFSL